MPKNCNKKKSSATKPARRTYKHLSLAKTKELRKRARRGESTAALAAEFGCHPTTVRAIRAGRTKRGL